MFNKSHAGEKMPNLISNKKEKISIIIPTYNSALTISDVIKSLTNQKKSI